MEHVYVSTRLERRHEKKEWQATEGLGGDARAGWFVLAPQTAGLLQVCCAVESRLGAVDGGWLNVVQPRFENAEKLRPRMQHAAGEARLSMAVGAHIYKLAWSGPGMACLMHPAIWTWSRAAAFMLSPGTGNGPSLALSVACGALRLQVACNVICAVQRSTCCRVHEERIAGGGDGDGGACCMWWWWEEEGGMACRKSGILYYITVLVANRRDVYCTVQPSPLHTYTFSILLPSVAPSAQGDHAPASLGAPTASHSESVPALHTIVPPLLGQVGRNSIRSPFALPIPGLYISMTRLML
ncbi:hypothetical protein DM02DRAFT_693492 [Periconia macrospinosa]|uniref:Uncharacterized protein n=1 Tax=Periconia macrospinosa TaxID=97972 RepID=A0A2V1D8C6_9PLEO|nr:hypothetical protein DM02DRAFT_693492 [Periconia macrospinosa]